MLKNDFTKIMFFCGTFNPLHSGHIKAASLFWNEYRLIFGKCSHPYDKGNVEYSSDQFDNYGLEVIELTGQSYYSHYTQFKGNHNDLKLSFHQRHNINFLVGLDTYLRIISPKYYLDSQELMEKTLKSMTATFHVLPRPGSEYVETDLIKHKYYPEFEPVNISSTQIRNKNV